MSFFVSLVVDEFEEEFFFCAKVTAKLKTKKERK